jgi:protein-tyrosine phosphatase
MIDLHAHVLPGLDDGVRTLEEAVALCRAAYADGVRTLVATPHVREDFPTTPGAMRAALTELRGALAAAGVELALEPGGEVAYTYLDRLADDNLRALALAGGPYLLLELPDHVWPLGLEQVVLRLRLAGLTPVISHPERCAELRARPQRAAELVRLGCGLQVTAAALDGRLGRTQQRVARRLVEAGLVHAVGSDAHHPSVRAAGLSGAVAALGDPGLARFLVEEGPRAIVAGEPLPVPPQPRRRRRLLGR